MRSLLGILIAGLAACAVPRNSGSGALIETDSPFGPQIRAAITELEPKIIAMLGTQWRWRYKVEVDLEFDRFRAETRTWDRRVKIGIQSLKPGDLEFVIAHELTHVHMTDRWRELPLVLQEGVADWVAISVLGRTGEFGGPKPAARLLLDVLTIPYREFKYADPVRQRNLEYAATWLALDLFPGGRVNKTWWKPVKLSIDLKPEKTNN